MEYTGKLYGKINRTYFPMIQTAADFDAMKRERDILEDKLAEICEPLHEFVEESDLADGTEAGHSVVKVAVQYGRRYRRERDEAREALRFANRTIMDLNTRAGCGEHSPENDPGLATAPPAPSAEKT